MTKIKQFLENKYVRNIFLFGCIFASFIILDFGFRYRYNSRLSLIDITISWRDIAPALFSLFYILLFSYILYKMPRKVGRWVYVVIYSIFILLAVSQSIHYETLGRFWAFSDLFSAGEGSKYFLDVLKNIDKKALIVLFACFLFMLFTFFIFKRVEKIKLQKKYQIVEIVTVITLLLIFRLQALASLGEFVGNGQFNAANAPRNIYEMYTDTNKSFMTSGSYEYTFRTIYIYLKDTFFHDYTEDHNDIDNFYSDRTISNEKNSHTGILKNKNIIYIMLESIDTWLVNEKVMPTLTKLQKEGINFTNRYAPTFGSGYTFNTEFALNTGLYSPTTGGAFLYTHNDYSPSLPNILKENGYIVNSLHMNAGTYYNRTAMHEALGFEHHYALKEMGYVYAKTSDDSFLAKTDEIYNLIVNKKEKFMTFITTYSPHIPYNNENVLCSDEVMEASPLKVEDSIEDTCVNITASKTDEFLKILIERLEEDKLLDNTVLVIASDHYMYGYSDKEKLYEIKGTKNNNMLQHTPFVIWSKGIQPEINETPLGTIDILPTMLNMLGVKWNPTYYLGEDVYSNTYPGYVYFSDGSWYDGKKYHIPSKASTEEEQEISKEISTKISINDKIIKSNYFNYLKKKSSQK